MLPLDVEKNSDITILTILGKHTAYYHLTYVKIHNLLY